MMKASIIVSAFVFCFVIVATAVLGWNHQQTAERRETLALKSDEADPAVECPRAVLPAPAESAQDAEFDRPNKQPPTEEMLKEIESIRQQLGIQLFVNDPSEAEEQNSNEHFRNALKSALCKELNTAEPNGPQPSSIHDQFPPEFPIQSDPDSLQKQTSPLDVELVDELQEAVFALEQRAASLEEMQRYDDSDRTRRLANKLRKEIRTLQEDASQ